MFSYSDKYNRFILDVGTLDAYPKSPLCIWLDKIGKDNAAALQKMQYNWVVVLLLEDSCRRPKPHASPSAPSIVSKG